ncbi:hypothetical protein H4Q32_011831 [Labeo rohita]|uniref:Uncharacterized protein n=1 Tax=Labeo rohita TaxID=84645 RepID=A0ABQ8MKM1_LABRO|nr:hypothetical protein H4Q32_011831 [Labeo rohita]
MQRATKCAARLDLSRVFCPSNVRNCRSVNRANGSVLCRRYSVLPPPHDKEEKAMLDSMLRVDHAGEYGANRIYAGQMAFNEILGEHRVRPTLLLPLWNIAGFALGACTALLGKEGAMACTVALIKEFRDDEIEHHDTGLEHDAESVPGYFLLKTVIQAGCNAAIYISKRI